MRPGRRNAALAIGLALSTLAAGGCGSPAVEQPNLVLITVDTLRPDRLACYGGPDDVGRALCSIADRGARYVWALSPAPSTAPAIASILTSRYPSLHGVSQFATTRLADEAQTLAESLSAAGYRTAAFIGNPAINRSRQLDQGFEIYDDRMSRRERNRRAVVEREAETNTDAALAWARVVSPPFFLWIHYQDPHGPYERPGAPPVADVPGAHSLPALQDQSGRGGIPLYQRLDGVYSVDAYESRYLDEIRYLDEHVERLLRGIESLDAPKGTGVLLTADHGEAFGEDDYWFAHGHSLGLDQVRVPLLWRPPGGADAREIRVPTSTIDVAPTLLAAAGVPIPGSFLGRVLPESEDESHASRPIFSEHRLRAAVAAGRVYYARDREPLEAPYKDRITGGWLHPMPPRTARLGYGGRAPLSVAAESDDGAGALEELLSEYLAAVGERKEPETSELDPQTREELRALGYLE